MIDSGTVSKIQKARQYAEERDERIRFTSFTIEIEGENMRGVTWVVVRLTPSRKPDSSADS